jgi:RHS repeat-associated protein
MGEKVKKIVVLPNSQGTLETDYLDGYQYVNGKLKFFPHEEGYINCIEFADNDSKFQYVYNYTDHLGNIRVSYGLDPETHQIKVLEENHYYPFGLKHENYNSEINQYGKESNAVVLKAPQPSPIDLSVFEKYKYKYNGKEFQDELGLNVTAMDFRQYDSAIGRFNGMDRLAEMSHNITPYRFAFNNPVVWSDPSGLFETRKEARQYRRENGIQGRIQNNGQGGFDINNYETGINYSSGNDEGFDNDANANDGVIESALVVNNNGGGDTMSAAIWAVNTSVGFASLGVGYQGQFHKMNEAYHITKSRGTSYFWQNKWKSPVAKQWRVEQISKVQGARNLATKLTKVGGVLLVGDIALSGDIKPSHVINGLMLGASLTGVGSIVAGVWFVADFGTMGVNYLINGEVKGIGDMIDESDWGKSKTVKMYDGLY